MFDECLTWLECQPEATVANTAILRDLQALAYGKRPVNMRQKKII